MKYILFLGFVGVASARDCYTHEIAVEGCTTTATYSGHGGFYYCLDPAPCPAGWATTKLGTAIGGALGAGHCYLMHSTLPDSDVDTICAVTSGDFCPVGQSPLGGECRDDNAHSHCQSVDVSGCEETNYMYKSSESLYWCKTPVSTCPDGWAETVSNEEGSVGHDIGVGHCYLIAASDPKSCTDASGDFCPTGQSPLGGECGIVLNGVDENEVGGCTDLEADNYSADATDDDGSCVYTLLCTGLETNYRSKCGCGN